MSTCPNCGSPVNEQMSFCPKCGAPVKIEATAQPAAPPAPPEAKAREYRRGEKSEKGEKGEKHEKEKGEKREYGFLGPLIGGLVLIFIGLASYIEITGMYDRRVVWAFFFLLVGVVIIVAAIYGALVLTKRHPKP